MPNKINLTGTSGKTYDLDDIKNEPGRSNSSRELIVQVWYWNPNLLEPHNNPNPSDLVIGQIWLSKFAAEGSEEYNKLKEGK